jgi:hypothetical protein
VQRFLRTSGGLSLAAVILMSSGAVTGFAQTRQQHVHEMAPSVMPFDISKTVHIFKMTESGGVQRVIVKDPRETEQIERIRRHLREEAARFQRGDYSDPARLHGPDMPGLKDLEAGASRIQVSYASLPAGAEIEFQTRDLHLLTALHRWFGAQLSEHGSDARAE